MIHVTLTAQRRKGSSENYSHPAPLPGAESQNRQYIGIDPFDPFSSLIHRSNYTHLSILTTRAR
jgi:hypothetical protein